MTSGITIGCGRIEFRPDGELVIENMRIEGREITDDEPVTAQFLGAIIAYLEDKRREALVVRAVSQSEDV